MGLAAHPGLLDRVALAVLMPAWPRGTSSKDIVMKKSSNLTASAPIDHLDLAAVTGGAEDNSGKPSGLVGPPAPELPSPNGLPWGEGDPAKHTTVTRAGKIYDLMPKK
jgi:hypothetical protein